ncbi:peptidase M10A and M12B matrixin and adamalysin [Saliphagus sp. GCM10025334]
MVSFNAPSVKRRSFLVGVGSLGTLGTLRYATREPSTEIEVRFWLTEQASTYDIADLLTAHLEAALEYEFWDVDVSFGGVVPVDSEDGARPVRSGRWPLAVGSGATGLGSVDAAKDVNLLVTDGPMHTSPTGYAIPHVASVGGARHIAELEPPDQEAVELPYSRPNLTIQVVIHEVGHTLGLRHEHGRTYVANEATVSTPMMSAYAWDSSFDSDESRCGQEYALSPYPDRKLTHRFSLCAESTLREYKGGVNLR